ncbi:hypothetical protein J4573_05995 [Actinomadura barringtoniae]|uniref:Uncharacterized protein n=1 Tax=Actinomadura barringtoniae TaxID=1427535 RepID=A0A939T3G7_9ACTN|nr:hypothetical protein [Actinomadura barringtoniae]MBO2446634.1 hypothetical protein [Actinomadura barringtoniae]
MSDKDRVLSDEDQKALRVWRDALVVQDQRLENKGVLKLAAMSMVDEDFRSRLVNDPESVLKDVRAQMGIPESVALRFFDITMDTVNIVLPPRAGSMTDRPKPLRDLLQSRTAELSFGGDDFDFGNLTDSGPLGHVDGGDGHPVDGSIFQPPS